MTTLTTIATLYGLATNPAVQLGGAAIFALALGLGAYAVKTQPKARDVAQDIADLEIEIEPWVLQAERVFTGGDAKYSAVMRQAKDWLSAQGVTGRKGRLVQKYLPGLIEAAVKRAKSPAALPAETKAAG